MFGEVQFKFSESFDRMSSAVVGEDGSVVDVSLGTVVCAVCVVVLTMTILKAMKRRVRAMKITRDPSACLAEVPKSAGAFDPVWAKGEGFTTLCDYLASLRFEPGWGADAESDESRWKESALLAILKAAGAPDATVASLGCLFPALPVGGFMPSSVPASAIALSLIHI